MTHHPARSDARPSPSVRKDGPDVLIALPPADATLLRPLLRSCSCSATKSAATTAIRDRFRRAVIGAAGEAVRWPMRDIHGLRVALNPCGCLAAKEARGRDLLTRLAFALGKAEATFSGGRL